MATQDTSIQRQISRRQFLIGATTVSVVALGGAGVYGFRQPPLEFVEESMGGEANTQGKILVAYASQYGSTGGVAHAIGQAFYASGVAVDVRRVENVGDLSPYRAAVIGAPVISNEWMASATSFVETHREHLAQIPVGYFLTCMMLALSKDPLERGSVVSVLKAVQDKVPEVQPVDLGLFAGAVDYGKMSPVNQALYRYFSEDDTDGDYRDWGAIREWATALRPRLGL